MAFGVNTETVISFAVLVAAASAAFFSVGAICKRLRSVTGCYVLAGFLWMAALVSVWFIGTNVPLDSSHFRPGGEAAPVWLATLTFFVRSAALASIVVAVSRHRIAEEPNK
jgi:hypothetical protein